MNAALGFVVIIILHTPIWVWGLYGLLLTVGFLRSRDSIQPVWRMLILPGAVTLLTISSLVGAGPAGLPAMLAGFALGLPLGYRLEPQDASRRLPDGRMWLRGEWRTFTQIAVVLVFRYVTGAAAALQPGLNADPIWHPATLFVGAILSALFLGRTAARLRLYLRQAPAIG